MRNLKSDRDVEVVREIDLLVRFTIVVGILEDDQLVAREGVAYTVMGITGHGRDPQPPLVVEGHLNRVGQVGKTGFISE